MLHVSADRNQLYTLCKHVLPRREIVFDSRVSPFKLSPTLKKPVIQLFLVLHPCFCFSTRYHLRSCGPVGYNHHTGAHAYAPRTLAYLIAIVRIVAISLHARFKTHVIMMSQTQSNLILSMISERKKRNFCEVEDSGQNGSRMLILLSTGTTTSCTRN